MGMKGMTAKTALTKLQTILLIDLIIVAAAAGGLIYLQSLPAAPIDPANVQLTNLNITPAQVSINQSVTVTFNATNLGNVKGTYEANLLVDDNTEQTQIVQLAGKETKIVEFITRSTVEGTHMVKVNNLEGSFIVQSKFTLTDLVVNRTQAGIGEPIGISAKITNQVEQVEEYSVSLTINGELAETKTGQLEGGTSASLLFEVVEQAEGTYTFTVGNLNGTFQVFPAAPPAEPAEFEVNNLIIDPQITEPDSPVQISVNVTNVGEESGSYTVELKISDAITETKTLQLSGGESTTAQFSVTETGIGTYVVEIGDLTGEFSVQSPSTISLDNMFVSPYEVWVGDEVSVTVKTSNPGSETSSLSLKLVVDGVTKETKTVTLAAGASQNVVFTTLAETEGAHSVAVNTLTYGGYKVVKTGYHTLSVSTSPAAGVEFNLDGVKRQTFYSELLPVGETYVIEMPITDPEGRYTFQNWDDGSTDPVKTVTLTQQTTVTASFTGGSSCPSLYMWNGSDYVYVGDISNHGWLGYIKYKDSTKGEEIPFTFYRNNPWDYIPLNRTQLQETDGNFSLSLIQRWNEIFYIDRAYMVAVDHPKDVNVYSTMVEEYLDEEYMGNIYTVSKTPQTPISAVNEKGENVLPQISIIDDVFTNGTHGIQSPSWDKINWNRITLDLGNLSDAEQIKLVVRSVVDWGSADDYDTWLGYFYDPTVPDGTEVTPPPYMEVKDVEGNWVKVDWNRQFPLPSDSAPRTFVVDLTGLFPTDDYSLRISNFWNVTFDYIGIDTTPQLHITKQIIEPQAQLYKAFDAGSAAATGNFTRYGNVTELLLAADDMFVIGRQGDAVALQFSTANISAPVEGMVRDYFFFESCWFKDENGNWGFGFDFTVDPLPFEDMSSFPYPATETYHTDVTHQNYLREWNTRVIEVASAEPSDSTHNMAYFSVSPTLFFIVTTIYVIFKCRVTVSLYLKRGKSTRNGGVIRAYGSIFGCII